METIIGKTAILGMLNEHTLLVTMKESEEVDLEAAIENYEISVKLTKGKRYITLVDARNHVTITDEAKKYAAQPFLYTHVIAQAIVINSLATRLLANFLIKFARRNANVDMRLFNDYNKALDWLNERAAQDEMALVS